VHHGRASRPIDPDLSAGQVTGENRIAFDDANFGQRLFEYLNEQPDFQVCEKVENGEGAVLELAAEDNLQVANAFKQHIPSVPLLLVTEEVSLETEKKALASPGAWCGCSVPKQDHPAALAPNVRALYKSLGVTARAT
jgi:hypothetical protein